MEQIKTTKSVSCISKRMKEKGFSVRRSTMTPFARIYTKDGFSVMYIFQKLINKSKMSRY